VPEAGLQKLLCLCEGSVFVKCGRETRPRKLLLRDFGIERDTTDAMATNSIKLLTGNSHPQLAKQVAEK